MNIPDGMYKSHGVLWSIQEYVGNDYQIDAPYCPKWDCRTQLRQVGSKGLYCVNCARDFTFDRSIDDIKADADRKLQGYVRRDLPVYSLDSPPTRVVDEDKEDENYWVQARISEKDGKRMAVVYFGERVREQTQKDYTQLFLDFEDEQLRFDKSNKNPMKLLCKLTAEFQESVTTVQRRDA
jgi:hypothetical protein